MNRYVFILLVAVSQLSAQELQFQQEQYPFPVTFYGVEPQLGFTAATPGIILILGILTVMVIWTLYLELLIPKNGYVLILYCFV